MMALHVSIPFSVPKVSAAILAAYALWVLLAGTVKMPSWFLRQSVDLAMAGEKFISTEKR
jgi:hypothetical protein